MSASPSAGPSTNQEVFNVDEIEVLKVMEDVCGQVDKQKLNAREKWPCKGVLITFPEGMNEHTLYPFGIHQELVIPWNYLSIDDKFYLKESHVRNHHLGRVS